MSKKIFEIKQGDFLKGLALQGGSSYGGLFKILQNIDPFEQLGALLPSLSPTLVSTGTAIKFLKSWNDGAGNSYIYGHSATKLYRILGISPFTVSDQTAQVFQSVTPTAILGTAVWGSYYIYAYRTAGGAAIRSNVFPVLSGSDTVITPNGFPQSASTDFTPFCTGANGALYCGDYQSLRIITSGAGTSGNVSAGNIDAGFTVRDIVNDGRYLVILADNNAVANAQRQPGKYRCRIYFWDMALMQSNGTTISPAVVYDVDDSYLIGAKVLDGDVYFFGYNGFYVCNSGTHPKMIRPFVGSSNFTMFPTGRPANPAQITSNKGSIFWLDGAASAQDSVVFAYGNPITGQQKIFYQPYGNFGFNATGGALTAAGDLFFAADATPQILVYRDGNSTRGTARVVPTSITMKQPFKFDYTKVVLTAPLSTGQTVAHNATSQVSTIVSGSETKSYAAASPKQELLFRRSAASAVREKFEELQPSVTFVGTSIQRIAVYGTPQDDANADF